MIPYVVFEFTKVHRQQKNSSHWFISYNSAMNLSKSDAFPFLPKILSYSLARALVMEGLLLSKRLAMPVKVIPIFSNRQMRNSCSLGLGYNSFNLERKFG